MGASSSTGVISLVAEDWDLRASLRVGLLALRGGRPREAPVSVSLPCSAAAGAGAAACVAQGP